MVYFTREYQNFFKQLSRNNSKPWFDANRKRYEEHVKQPFAAFVEVMINLIRTEDPEVQITAKDAIFRINRDIRFSKKLRTRPTWRPSFRSRARSPKNGPGSTFSSRQIELRLAAEPT